MVRQIDEDTAVGVGVGSKEILRHAGEVFSLPKYPVTPVHVLLAVPESGQMKLIHGRDLQHPVCQ